MSYEKTPPSPCETCTVCDPKRCRTSCPDWKAWWIAAYNKTRLYLLRKLTEKEQSK